MLYTSCCILHTPCACTYDNLLASQDVFIHSYIHLMSTAQLDRSRSPTMPCILLVIGVVYESGRGLPQEVGVAKISRALAPSFAEILRSPLRHAAD